MIRLLISFGIQLLANAIGLLAAAAILDKMEVSVASFVVAVVIFTLAFMLFQPFLTQLALSKAQALRGGVALVATLIALIVTDLISDGFTIDGVVTWVEATVIVWLFSLVGAMVLPAILIKKRVEEKRG